MDKALSKIIIEAEDDLNLSIGLYRRGRVLGIKPLTISQEFDRLLITAIDKLTDASRIERLSLRSLEMRGKMKNGTVSAMIMTAVGAGLEV